MKNANSSCSKFFGSAVLAGVIAILGLAWAVYTFDQNNRDTQRELDNQTIQISHQQTQIALADEQNQLQSQQLTLMAQKPKIDGQFLTPAPSDSGDFSLTATAFFIQATQIEATSKAVATRQKAIEVTQTAVALQATPSVVIRADDVTPQIKGVDNGIQNVLSWWREYEPTGDSGEFSPTSFAGNKCYGLAWNTNQYGYHRLVVLQNTMSITFAAGGWYVKVCIPDYIVISANDIGKIKADWLGKKYGDTQNYPWQVITNP